MLCRNICFPIYSVQFLCLVDHSVDIFKIDLPAAKLVAVHGCDNKKLSSMYAKY